MVLHWNVFQSPQYMFWLRNKKIIFSYAPLCGGLNLLLWRRQACTSMHYDQRICYSFSVYILNSVWLFFVFNDLENWIILKFKMFMTVIKIWTFAKYGLCCHGRNKNICSVQTAYYLRLTQTKIRLPKRLIYVNRFLIPPWLVRSSIFL